MDANPEAFEHARLKYTRPGVRFVRNMIELHAEPCDAVVFLQTIEHVPDPEGVLRHFREMAGTVYVSTPNLLTLAPPGRGQVGEPVAPARVPGGRVPRAVRERVRARRAVRALPRAQAARARARAPRRLGRRARRARDHRGVLRPLHPGHRHARLRASPGRRSSGRSTSSRSCGDRAAARGARAPPPLAHALRGGLRHLAVRRGVALGGGGVGVPAAPRGDRRRAGDRGPDARAVRPARGDARRAGRPLPASPGARSRP